jgi:hypothetical protein
MEFFGRHQLHGLLLGLNEAWQDGQTAATAPGRVNATLTGNHVEQRGQESHGVLPRFSHEAPGTSRRIPVGGKFEFWFMRSATIAGR